MPLLNGHLKSRCEACMPHLSQCPIGQTGTRHAIETMVILVSVAGSSQPGPVPRRSVVSMPDGEALESSQGDRSSFFSYSRPSSPIVGTASWLQADMLHLVGQSEAQGRVMSPW